MTNSMSLTGTCTILKGQVMFLMVPGQDAVVRMITKQSFKAKMGVHMITHETLYHPVDAPGFTFFGSYFKPANYGYSEVSLESIER